MLGASGGMSRDRPQRRPARIEEENVRGFVEAAVARAFALPVAELRQPTRRAARVAFARQVAMYVAHVGLGLSLTAAARLFGRDRTTASHACRVVEDRRDEPEVEALLAAIETVTDAWRRLLGPEGPGGAR